MTPKTIIDIQDAKHARPIQYWGPVITEGSLTLLVGERGCGKTFFGSGLSIAMATASKFLKFAGERPARVLYANGEMPEASIQHRLKGAEHLLSDMSISNLQFLSYAQCDGGQMWNLSDPLDQRKYENLMTAFDVIVIDNLLTCSRRKDRWDDPFKIWERIQPLLIRWRDAGKAAILIHHTAKSGEQSGTIEKENVVDTYMMLKKVPSPAGLAFNVIFRKARNFYGDDERSLYCEMVTDEGKQYWNWSHMDEWQTDKIAQYLKEGWKPQEIVTVLGCSYEAVRGVKTQSDSPPPTTNRLPQRRPR